jgi:hypothetical protein
MHVERIVRDFRRCKEVEELGREAQQQASRQVNWFYDSEGMLNIKARLPAEAGQMFIKAIQAACEEISSPEVSAETPNVKFRFDPAARKADALALVVETFLAQGPTALKGGDRPPSRCSRGRRDIERQLGWPVRLRARPIDVRGNRAPAIL